jgi:hypothetical protein
MCYLFIIITISFAGCIFAPGLTDDDPGSSGIVTQQGTPQDVLTNFRYAYKFADSLIYSDVLDSSFIFISKNYSTSPPTDIIWGRDVDIKTTAGMFRYYNVLELTWGIPDTSRSFNIDGQIPDSLAQIVLTFQLTLDGGRDVPTLKGEALFRFALRDNQIWRITRWEDRSSF